MKQFETGGRARCTVFPGSSEVRTLVGWGLAPKRLYQEGEGICHGLQA